MQGGVIAADTSTFVAQWGVVVDAFNRGDLRPLSEQLTEDCTWLSSTGTVGNSRDEIIEAVNSARTAGWASHHVLGLMTAGDVVVGVYRNEYADGSSQTAGAVQRIDDHGRVAELRSLEPG